MIWTYRNYPIFIVFLVMSGYIDFVMVHNFLALCFYASFLSLLFVVLL